MAYFECIAGTDVTGTASPSEVLSGASFMSELSDDVQLGTMPDNGAFEIKVTPGSEAQEIAIPEGYHNGNGRMIVSGVTPLEEYSFTTGAYASARWNGSDSGGTRAYSGYVYINTKGYSKIKISNKGKVDSGFGYSTNDFIADGTYDTKGVESYNIGRMYVTSTSSSINVLGYAYCKVTLIP